ncbi:MAG TPA: AAA family ATPase [Candidatus Dojkabacteria bacterium]|nr:AAA family ATPase [Candidatus Dojkabacteria bacterium]
MKVNSITLKNIKNFKDEITFQFLEGLNIFIGPNGGGKSNLLEIVAATLSTVIKQYRITNIGDNGKTLRINDAGHNDNQKLIFVKNILTAGYTDEQKLSLELLIEEEDFTVPAQILAEWEKISDQKVAPFSLIEGIEWLDQFKELTERVVSAKDVLKNKPLRLVFNLNNGFPQLVGSSNTEEGTYIKYLNEVEKYRVVMYLARDILGEAKSIYIPPVTMLYISPFRALSMPQDIRIHRENPNDKYVNSDVNMYAQQSQMIRQMNSIDYISPALQNLVEEYYTRKWAQEGKEPELKSAFFKDVQKAINEALGFSLHVEEVAPPISYSFKVRTKDNLDINVNDLSSGEKQIIYLIFALYAKQTKTGIMIIDEPELHLHKKFQNFMLKLLRDLTDKSKNYQIMLSTHSPTIVSEKTLQNVTRVYKENHSSKKATPSKEQSRSLKDELMIINTQNNERIFFADKVVLVEGQIDKTFVAAILEEIISTFEIRETIEVVEVNGKTNFNRYRAFLDSFEINNYIIADFDYINNVSSLNSTLNPLFETSEKALDTIIKDKDGKDSNTLISVLDQAISEGDLEKLKGFSDYLKSRSRRLKGGLSEEETQLLKQSVENLYAEKTYILYTAGIEGNKGVIEDYLPEGYKAKDIEKIVKLVNSKDFYVHIASDTIQNAEIVNILWQILGLKEEDKVVFLTKMKENSK